MNREYLLNDNILSIIRKKYWIRNAIFNLIGIIFCAVSFNLFFLPYQITSTGSSGFSYLISYVSGYDIALVTLIVNLLLLMFGLIAKGYDYVVKMLFITLTYPLFLKITLLFTKQIIFNDQSLFLMMVIGGALMGFGTGLIRKSGYNPGGFAVLFDYMNDKFYISIGKSTIIINSLLIIASGFIFSFTSAVYACIGLIVSSYVVDKVIIGVSYNKTFYIISDKLNEINDYIVSKMEYHPTIVNARGGYSNKKKKMLMCVVPTNEYVRLKELVKVVDNDAFFLIVDTYESTISR